MGIISGVVTILLFSVIFIFSQKKNYRENTIDELRNLAMVVGYSIETPMVFEQYEEIGPFLQTFKNHKQIDAIWVAKQDSIIAKFDRGTHEFVSVEGKQQEIREDGIYVKVNLFSDGSYLASIILKSNKEKLDAALNKLYFNIGIISLIVLSGAFFATFYTQYSISTPLRELVSISKSISSGDLDKRAQKQSISELDTLSSSFNSMVETILNEKEKAEEAANFKANFLANMSHEIRTPMNGIVGVIEMLKQTKINEEQADMLNIVDQSSSHLITIINDILDLSKLEAGEMKLFPKRTEIKATIERIGGLFNQKLKEKGLEAKLVVEDNVPQFVFIDEIRVSQILTNFLSNAVKFTDEGFVGIQLKVVNEYLRFEVIDSGVGMTDADKNKLFQSFVQLDITSTKSHQGTGLGLAISRNLIHLFKGKLGVESKVGKGSTFWFEIPLELPTTQQLEDKAKEAQNKDRILSFSEGLKVLVVDDKSTNRKVAKLILSKFKIKVDEAESGFECIDKYKADPTYDLIFMDIQMPEMDGIETFCKLKEQFQNLAPVYALTANAMEGDREKYLDAGMNGYVSKPISLDKLLSVFEELMEQKGS